MLIVLKLAGLIFEQFGKLLADEFFWIMVLLLIILYKRNSAMEARMLGNSYSLLAKVSGSVFVGFAGGLLGSLLVVLVGISLEDYTSAGGSIAEGITYIWVAAILLSLINPRYLCFSYGGGLIALMNLIFGFPLVNVPGLLALIGVLHLIESFLIWLDGYAYSVPLFIRRKDEKTVGGYVMNRIWPIPLVVFAVIFGGEEGRVSIAGLVDMPSWWPFLKHTAAGGIRDLIYIPLMVPVILGYGDMALTKKPEEKCKSSAIRLACYSLVLIILSIAAAKINFFAFAAAVFAPLAHEMLIVLGSKEEEEGMPFFSSTETGLKVLYVSKSSVAGSMGIDAGDTILSINGMSIFSERQLVEFLSNYPPFIWLDIMKADGKSYTSEYSDYRNGIGSLGALIVPHSADFYYEISKGSSLVKRLADRLKRKRGNGMDV